VLGLLEPHAWIGTAGGERSDGAEQERGSHGYCGSHTKRQPQGADRLRPRGWNRDRNRIQLIAKPCAEGTLKRGVQPFHTNTDA
jgi:hypothetical protein